MVECHRGMRSADRTSYGLSWDPLGFLFSPPFVVALTEQPNTFLTEGVSA